MVYHFVKHIGFDIKADSLEQAKKIAEFIDDDDSIIEDAAYDSMSNAIDDALDVGVLREDFYDNCDVHAGSTEFVGVTETKGENNAEERFYDYMTDDDDCDEHDNRVADEREVPDEFVDVIADAIAKAIITLLGI